MHPLLSVLIVVILWGTGISNATFAQNNEDPCLQAQSQLRYYFMEYNEEGYLNLKYLEDLYYTCDSVNLRSTISYYYLKSISLLSVKENYVAKPSELFYFYYNKFKAAAYYSSSLRTDDPEFVAILAQRSDQLAMLVDRAESLGDQPFLDDPLARKSPTDAINEDPLFNPNDPFSSSQRRQNQASSSSFEVAPDFAAFPYPVEEASDHYSFDARTFQLAGNLGDIDRQLTTALNAEGYYGKRYFSMPEGFALVTQMERIYPNGTPYPTLERWRTSVKPKPQFSLREYMLSLVFSEKGYYRTFAFVVLPRTIAENPAMGMGRLNPAPWMTISGEKLPEAIAQLTVSNDYVVKAYLFVFDVPGGADNAVLVEVPIGSRAGTLAQKHLAQANLLPRIQR